MDAINANPQSGRIYRDVPRELVEHLETFRSSYPYQSASIGGVTWPYIDTKQGEQTVLVLAGAGCIAEISWRTIEWLARRFRVIAPDYPAIDTVSELLDGIMGVLDHVGVERAHVMGGSYGGLMAQALVRRFPDRVIDLILSHTLLPTRALGQQNASAQRWISLMPAPLIRALFKRSMSRLYTHTEHPEVALIKAHFEDIMSHRLTRAQIISVLRRAADLGLNQTFTPGDLDSWPGRILLMLADDDPASPEPVRQALAAMYPRARMQLFSGGGHLTSVLKQEEYINAIEAFLIKQG